MKPRNFIAMENFVSPEDALSALQQKGYKADLAFETDPYGLYCSDLDMRLNPEAYHVDEKFHFDEPGNADGSEDVYAISSCTGVKGFVVDEHDEDGRPTASGS